MTRWLALLLLWPSVAFAAPDTSMSVSPSATSGATITASDENTRNNSIASTFNNHSHTDISQTASTLNIGVSAGGTSISSTGAVVLEGSSADGFETTLTLTDPTADQTITLPNSTGFLSVWANQNTTDVNQIWEGATANAFETTVSVTDPTADRTISLPDGDVTIANTGITLEGSGDDGFETTLAITNPTADQTITFPNATFTVPQPTVADRVHRTAGDVATTSTSLVDFTGASITLTTGANPVLVGLSAGCSHGSVGGNIELNVDIDGADENGTDGMILREDSSAAGEGNCSFVMMTSDLTAGAHTIKLQWQTDTGTATMRCNSTNACTFWAAEVLD